MVTGQTGGTVSWGSRKIFGSGGVSIMGLAVEPKCPIPNKILKTEIVTRFDSQFENIKISALWLTNRDSNK